MTNYSDPQNQTQKWLVMGGILSQERTTGQSILCIQRRTSQRSGKCRALVPDRYRSFKQERHRDAIKMYRNALKYSPGNNNAHLQLGIAFHEVGMYKEAKAVFSRLIENQPSMCQAWMYRGSCLVAKEQYKEALADLEEATDCGLSQVEIWVLKGYCYEQLGDHQAAIDAYQIGCEISPDDSMPFFGLASALSHIGENEQAVEALFEAVKQDPEFADA